MPGFIRERLGYLSRNPKIIPRLMKNYSLMFISGKKRLRTVELSLTAECQCACKHCYAEEYRPGDEEGLSRDEMKKVVDSAFEQGAIHFLLTGGEPLLSGDIYHIMGHIKSRGGIISLATNGISLDSAAIRKLKSMNVDLVEVSLDFDSTETHCAFRGMGGDIDIWERVLESSESGIRTGISILAQKGIIESGELKRIIQKARRNNIGASICYPCALGKWKGRTDELLKDEHFKKVDALKEELRATSCEDNSYLGKGCTAGTEKVYVSANGDVTPCPLIPMRFGNIREESLPDILGRIRKNSYFSRKNPRCLPASDRDFISGLR